jgi:hypothetical protein
MSPTIDAMGSVGAPSRLVEHLFPMSKNYAEFALCDKQICLQKGISAGQRLNSMGPYLSW